MVNLISNVPSRVRLSPQIQQLKNAEDPEYQGIHDLVNKWLLNLSPAIADIDGIAKYEEWLDLEVGKDDTMDERRQRVILALTKQLPYTLVRLHRMLASTVGEDNYSLYVHLCELYLEVNTYSNAVFKSIVEMLERIVPVNVHLNVCQNYNKYNLRLVTSCNYTDGEINILPKLTKSFDTLSTFEIASTSLIRGQVTITPRQKTHAQFSANYLTSAGTCLELECTILPKVIHKHGKKNIRKVAIGSTIAQELTIKPRSSIYA